MYGSFLQSYDSCNFLSIGLNTIKLHQSGHNVRIYDECRRKKPAVQPVNHIQLQSRNDETKLNP